MPCTGDRPPKRSPDEDGAAADDAARRVSARVDAAAASGAAADAEAETCAEPAPELVAGAAPPGGSWQGGAAAAGQHLAGKVRKRSAVGWNPGRLAAGLILRCS